MAAMQANRANNAPTCGPEKQIICDLAPSSAAGAGFGRRSDLSGLNGPALRASKACERNVRTLRARLSKECAWSTIVADIQRNARPRPLSGSRKGPDRF